MLTLQFGFAAFAPKPFHSSRLVSSIGRFNTNPKAPVGDWELYKDARADEQPRDRTEVIVAKHRNGPTGIATLKWFEEYTLFRSVSRKD